VAGEWIFVEQLGKCIFHIALNLYAETQLDMTEKE